MSNLIVTSCWFTPLPDAYCRIGVSRGTPRNQRGYSMYRKLQPPKNSLRLADGPFTIVYYADVLERLNPQRTVDDLLNLARGKIPALLCFEATHDPAWCHRGMISAWFQATLGLDVPEFDREEEGCGLNHPKLCPEARAHHARRHPRPAVQLPPE
jgi:hypothetical protein